MLPQDPQALFVKKTVREDLYEAFDGQRVEPGLREKRVAQAVSLCRLTELLDRHPYDLSGGEQQRAALCKVLLLDPEILLLDEPTAGVDVGSKREIIDKVRDFVGENRAAIFISSDILELISACDRFIVFYDGKVTATYDRSEITEEVLQYAIQNEC